MKRVPLFFKSTTFVVSTISSLYIFIEEGVFWCRYAFYSEALKPRSIEALTIWHFDTRDT